MSDLRSDHDVLALALLPHHRVVAVQVLPEEEALMTGETTGEAEVVVGNWTIVPYSTRSMTVGSMV